MFGALLILIALPVLDISRIRSSAFRPIMKVMYWFFIINFLILLWLGGQHVEEPYIILGQVCTAFYFLYFLLFIPVIGLIENTLIDIAINNEKETEYK